MISGFCWQPCSLQIDGPKIDSLLVLPFPPLEKVIIKMWDSMNIVQSKLVFLKRKKKLGNCPNLKLAVHGHWSVSTVEL